MNATSKLHTGFSLLFGCLASLFTAGCSTQQVVANSGYYVPGDSWISVTRISKHKEPGKTFHFDWGDDQFWERNGLRGHVEAYTMSIAPYSDDEVVSALLEHSVLSGGEVKYGACFFQLNMLIRIINHLSSGEIVSDRLAPLKSDRFVVHPNGSINCFPSPQDIGLALRRAFDLHALKQ